MNNRAEFKITTLLFSITLIGLFVGAFGMLASNVAVNYGATYNDSSFSSFNKMQQINNMSLDIKTSTEETSQKTGVVDVLGDYFAAGYKSTKLTFKSVDLLKDITQSAVVELDMGGIGSLLNTALISMIVIAFVVGIILSALVKKEL